MALPADISVSFDFSSGATFGYPFTIGDAKYGVLGTGTLAASTVPTPIIDLTPSVRSITIDNGRNIQSDTYQAGTAVTGSQGSQFGPGPYLPIPETNVQTGAFPRSQPGDFRRAEERSNLTGPMQVVVQIDGKAIASSLQNSSLSGIGSTVNRIDR